MAIVEGDAEAILLPALAQAVGRSFSECGVSVVNVGGVGLFRYSRILQRDGEQIPVTVACIRDRDLFPAGTSAEMRKKLKCSAEMLTSASRRGDVRARFEESAHAEGRPARLRRATGSWR
ncbi:hypothetical protein SGFS_009770 [Streptomyces graminofaciens]|uniref:OLD protein-like TOPRIM domain-containing protein n=1 Tax=Streptomyces graminofaciens TaxID=68212 RepID=A0ABM7F1P2_9ACTN|nr:TOPRIM nucleotidyl transferase/hydrolase domain-containing protein [Streptomyces graminofaciens]BBC29683.1 hypothetical protein SGFS_009770 [Streptomyces graminofaciens]